MMTVEDVLAKNNIHFKASGDKLTVRCLSPSHEDRHPSMIINRMTGDSTCFSCGYHCNVYKHFGINLSVPNLKVMKLLGKIDKLRNVEIKIPNGSTPYVGNYREIPQDLYDSLGVFTHLTMFKDRICFPIEGLDGRLRGVVHRDLYSDSGKKYLVYPRDSGVMPLYPTKLFTEKNDTLLLVEGVFDALNLHRLGFKNTLCTFGVSTIKSLAQDIVAFASAKGVTRIVGCFDNDKAGEGAFADLERVVGTKIPIVEKLDWARLLEAIGRDIKDVGELKPDEIFELYSILY